MEVIRKSGSVMSVVSMESGTVFKYAGDYYMVTDMVDIIRGDYVKCVNLHTGELKNFVEGTVCEYFTECKLLIG